MTGDNLFLKPQWEEKRESFRIDDTLAVIIRRRDEEPCFFEAETLADDPSQLDPSVLEKEHISPLLWKMMVCLHRKMDRLMDKIPVDPFTITPQPVDLSSTGIKLKIKEKFDLDESVRIKLFLPTVPVKELVVEGKVIRVENLPDGAYEVGLHFQNINETAKNEISRYTLNRQRNVLIEQKRKRIQDE